MKYKLTKKRGNDIISSRRESGCIMAYESKFKREDIDELFEAILTLKDQEDCYRFFEDICTINEIHAIAQRLQVARLLSEKKTYMEIKGVDGYHKQDKQVPGLWSRRLQESAREAE